MTHSTKSSNINESKIRHKKFLDKIDLSLEINEELMKNTFSSFIKIGSLITNKRNVTCFSINLSIQKYDKIVSVKTESNIKTKYCQLPTPKKNFLIKSNSICIFLGTQIWMSEENRGFVFLKIVVDGQLLLFLLSELDFEKIIDDFQQYWEIL